MSRSIEEARSEVSMASVFRRAPAEWAAKMVREADGQPTSEDLHGMFREVGLCESDARIAARGLREGTYLSFEDAVQSRLMWDSQGHNRVVSWKVAEVARRLPGRTTLTELRTSTQTRPQLLERASAALQGDGRLKVCLISEGQGSSGYYPASTLQAAATAGVFAKGTHCYVDHPTQSETYERPERSVRDLAGVLETAASYREGALYADVRVYASHRDLITDRASVIGMSIRGDGVVERKQINGATREVVTSLSRVASIDFVTRAGRGGRIISAA